MERGIKYASPASAAAEEGIIRLLYLEPALATAAAGSIRREEFTAPELGHIFSALLSHIQTNTVPSTNALAGELSPDEMSLFVRILQKPEVLHNASDTLKDYINTIHEQKELAAGTPDLRSLAQLLKDKGKGYKT